MAADFLNDWTNVVATGRNELVFEDKNKEYGAYDIRRNYNRTVVMAMIISCTTFVFLVSLPKIIELLGQAQEEEMVVNVNNDQILLDVPPPLEEDVPPPPPPPPPPVIETIKFTPPVVTDDEVIDEPPPVQTEETPQVSTVTQEGNGDEQIIIPTETGTGPVEVKEEIFVHVEQMPEFPGGEAALFKYLGQHTKYPAMEKENNLSGTVYLSFVVDKDGKVKNISVLREVKGAPGLTKEAIRVVETMPTWKAGKQSGRPVSVQYNLPFKFSLN